MANLVAKPVLKDQFWVVTDGEEKVGNITANNSGYGVNLNGSTLQFNNTKDIQKKIKIKFEPIKTNNTKTQLPYPEYPTTSRVYNSMFDIKHGTHLYTKSKDSKCYFAAGWYAIFQHEQAQVEFCPKYIYIQRYPFNGPFRTKEEATRQINNIQI